MKLKWASNSPSLPVTLFLQNPHSDMTYKFAILLWGCKAYQMQKEEMWEFLVAIQQTTPLRIVSTPDKNF